MEKQTMDSSDAPTKEQYEECAAVAHELNEFAALGKLDDLLPLEKDHSHLCNVGIWYCSLGHRMLASMAYKRSIELHPEAATYFNLAVCQDDLGNPEGARQSMEEFYKLVPTETERVQAEEMMRRHGKDHLIRPEAAGG